MPNLVITNKGEPWLAKKLPQNVSFLLQSRSYAVRMSSMCNCNKPSMSAQLQQEDFALTRRDPCQNMLTQILHLVPMPQSWKGREPNSSISVNGNIQSSADYPPA